MPRSRTPCISRTAWFPATARTSYGHYCSAPNRGRYFLYTGEIISAAEGKRLGFVAEVLPAERVLERAWELARELSAKPTLTLRYTRIALMEPLKRALARDLGYGLALEGHGA